MSFFLIYINTWCVQHYCYTYIWLIIYGNYFNVTYLYFVKIVNMLSYLHMPLYNIMLCPIKSSQFYNWFVKKQGASQNYTFLGSIRKSGTFIKIKVLRYLNNTQCIIDIVLCWSINMNYCYSLFLHLFINWMPLLSYSIFVDNFQAL